MVHTTLRYIFFLFGPRDSIQTTYSKFRGCVKGTLIVVVTLFPSFVIVYKFFSKVEVKGTSMLPTLEQGDRLLVAKLKINVGDLVVIKDPYVLGVDLVKRVTDVFENNGAIFYEVIGDNLGFSTDSRHFGPISSNHVIGKVVYRYAPNGRSGFIYS